MSRVVKNVIVWVLVLAFILCIIAGFTFGLSSVSGVADAMEVTLPDTGLVNPNLLNNSYYTEFANGAWSFPNSSVVDSTLGSDSYIFSLSGENSGTVFFIYNLDSYDRTSAYTLSCYLTFACSDSSSYLSVGIKGREPGSSYGVPTRVNASSTYQLVTFTIPANAFGSSYVSFEVYFSFEPSSYSVRPNFTCNLQWVKLEKGSNFTGYSRGDYQSGYDDGYNAGYDEGYNAGVTDGTQSGYDEGYEVGYDEGYNTGISDGLISANQIFNCSTFAVGWDDVNQYAYVMPSEPSGGIVNKSFTEIPGGFCPLSKIAFDSYGGGYLPIDLLPRTEGSSTNPMDSIYWLTFDSLLEVGQWLLDNPNDFLVSWTITGEADPAAVVFSDLSNLPNFMSGAGENYLIGYDEGYNVGYDDGDGAGYNRGYGVGFNAGQADAASGNYTFLALIGSVLDAPISAFKGLLDFELLGVNMSSFVLAIMSLCVIIVIIRVVLR